MFLNWYNVVSYRPLTAGGLYNILAQAKDIGLDNIGDVGAAEGSLYLHAGKWAIPNHIILLTIIGSLVPVAAIDL